MIFESDKVARLVLAWQSTHKPELMTLILELSESLIEVIISSYDPMDRDDLMQEACKRLQYACTKYDVRKGNLHNYFTTVIRNECNRYVQKRSKDLLSEDIETCMEDYADECVSEEDDSKLCDLRCHIRQRFSSLHAQDCDTYTTIIYESLMRGDSYVTIIRELAKHVTRHAALVIFNSALTYLRSENMTYAKVVDGKYNEFTLAFDLHRVLGDDIYTKVCAVFYGMNIKLPK